MATLASQISNNHSISQVYRQSIPQPAVMDQHQTLHPYLSNYHRHPDALDLQFRRKQVQALFQSRPNLQSRQLNFKAQSNPLLHQVQSSPRSQTQKLRNPQILAQQHPPFSQSPRQHMQATGCQQIFPLQRPSPIQSKQTDLQLLAALSQQNGQRQVPRGVMSMQSLQRLQRIQMQQRYAQTRRILSQTIDNHLKVVQQSVQLALQTVQLVNSWQPHEGFVLQNLQGIQSQAQQSMQTSLRSQQNSQQTPCHENIVGNYSSRPNSQQQAPGVYQAQIIPANQGGQNSQQQAPGIPQSMLGDQCGQNSQPQILPSVRALSTCPHEMPPRECRATLINYIGCPCQIWVVESCPFAGSRVEITSLGFEKCEKYSKGEQIRPGNCGGIGNHWACPAMPKFWHDYQVQNEDGSVVWEFTPEPYEATVKYISLEETHLERYYK